MFRKLFTLSLFVVCFVLLLFTLPVFANTIGFTYQRAIDETSLGVVGDYEQEVSDNVSIGVEGNLQSDGDSYIGSLDLALTYDLFLDIRFESNNDLKVYDWNDPGTSTDLGVSLVIPTGDVEWSVGIFGVRGNPFSPTYELSDPTDPTSVALADSGITIKDGSSLNVAVRSEFDVSRFEVGFRGLFEALGQGEKVHQATFDISTGGGLPGGFDWLAQGKVTVQKYGNLFEYEDSLQLSFNRPF